MKQVKLFCVVLEPKLRYHQGYHVLCKFIEATSKPDALREAKGFFFFNPQTPGHWKALQAYECVAGQEVHL